MFILNSDIPKELYNKLHITEEELETLTLSDLREEVGFVKTYSGNAYIINNTATELIDLVKDTPNVVAFSNDSYLQYPVVDFIRRD